MIRVLIFMLSVIVAAAALTFLLAAGGSASIDAFGWRFEVPAGAAIIAVAAFSVLLVLAASLIKDIVGAPGRARARRDARRREKGLGALAKGFAAVAAGDASAARKQAEIAAKALPDAAVPKILAAEAAALSRDEVAASDAHARLLDLDDAGIIGLRGLHAAAIRTGDADGARDYAGRAFALHPTARWAFEAVLDDALKRADYVAARALIAEAAKAKTIDEVRANRGAAAALTASAFVARSASNADAALKLAASLAPAAVIAARLHSVAGEQRKAAKILETAFAATGERAVAETYETIVADEPPTTRAASLERFAEKNPAAPEALLLRARASLLRGDAPAAARALEAALRSSATARALAMMAEAQRALHGDPAARTWLERAACAPRDPAPDAESWSLLGADGWAALIREFMQEGRLPPAGAEPAPGLDDGAFVAAPVEITLSPAAIDPVTDEMLDREIAAARGVS